MKKGNALNRFLCLTGLILLSAFLSFGDTPEAGRYLTHHLTTHDGLPQNTVYAVTQDKDGYIWIGTDEGVVRYDGVKFEHFNKLNTKNLKNNSITALCVAHDNTLWIGTFGGGVTLYNPKSKTFSSYTTQNGLPNDFIWTIIQDSNKNIWLGTNGGGIIRFKDDRFDTFTTADGLSDNIVNTIREGRNDSIWVGTENGLNRLSGSSITVYDTGSILPSGNVMTLFEDSRGVLWVGTANGLTAVRGKNVNTFTTDHGLFDNLVRAVYEDRHNNLWVATDRGLNRIHRLPRNEVGIEPFRTDVESLANSLMTIFEDREGNLWVGTSGQGLTVLHRGKFDTFTVENGLARRHIKTIYQDRTGAMWIGTNGGGVNVLKTGSVRTYTTDHGLADKFINSIRETEDGNTWIAADNGLSLYNSETGTFTTFSEKDGLSTTAVRVLYRDQSGNLLAGTYGGGVFRFDKENKKWRPLIDAHKLSDKFILCIAEDKDHNLWIGTNRGLNRLKDNTVQSYTREHGLSNDMIYDIFPDHDGTLWIGTNGGGLNRFKNGTFTHFTTRSGLLTDVIYRIIRDNKGNLWMSSNEGILAVSLRELNRSAQGTRSYLDCKYFLEEDGMQSAVCTGGVQPAGTKTKDGRLWFPTIRGIVVFDPAKITYNEVEPPVFIERVTADGVTQKLGKMFKIPAGTGTVKISFTALSYTAPRKVRFRYRLKGYDDDKWVETSSREQVVYTDLPSGRYTFEVIACNNDGVWNNKRTSAAFMVKLPFYSTLWFYLIAAVVLGIGGFWLFLLPEKRRKQREEEEEQKYLASTLTVPRARMHSRKIQAFVEKEKPYLDANLTAAKLAQALGMSKKNLSQVINQEFNLNFKNFINKYRVEEARKKLLDPREQDFVLMKIALDVGFNSKSVFNEAFKKFTGMSPSEYRKKHS
jgi:ligand-binding sensor domain-containing protein/AraC-like DNA-binding protein